MPAKNIVKNYSSDSFYHVYNRGHNKQDIFLSDSDYHVFLNVFRRYLTHEKVTDSKGRPYEKLHDQVELLAYCLMSNHYHLLIYQLEPKGMMQLMRRTMTTYGRFFNKKYNRVGSPFQSNYKASRIENETYLWHISRYIHLNPGPGEWQRYPHSSYGYYAGDKESDWVKPERILEMHRDYKSDYAEFVQDWSDYEDSLMEVSLELTGA